MVAAETGNFPAGAGSSRMNAEKPTKIAAIARLARAISNHSPATPPGACYAAALRLLGKRGWGSMREPLASHLEALAGACGGEQAVAYEKAAKAARESLSFAAFTRGVEPEMRAAAAVFALGSQ